MTKLSTFSQGQFPQHYSDEGSLLIEFISLYYEWLEQNGMALDVVDRISEFRDVDRVEERFYQFLKNEFLQDLPNNVLVDKAILLKNIKDFYRSRGSEKSYKFLFRILFNEEVDFYYPGQDILRSSHGKWVVKRYVEVQPLIPVENFTFVCLLRGESSNARVRFENIQTVVEDNGVTKLRLYYTSIYSLIEQDENIICILSNKPIARSKTDTIVEQGYFKNTDGFLSSDKRLQDNNFYQEYSYVLKSNLPIDTYRNAILNLVHPAGTKLFGQTAVNISLDQDFDVKTEELREKAKFMELDQSPYLDILFTVGLGEASIEGEIDRFIELQGKHLDYYGVGENQGNFITSLSRTEANTLVPSLVSSLNLQDNQVIRGTGTNFTQTLANGSFIVVYDNDNDSSNIQRVRHVANNTIAILYNPIEKIENELYNPISYTFKQFRTTGNQIEANTFAGYTGWDLVGGASIANGNLLLNSESDSISRDINLDNFKTYRYSIIDTNSVLSEFFIHSGNNYIEVIPSIVNQDSLSFNDSTGNLEYYSATPKVIDAVSFTELKTDGSLLVTDRNKIVIGNALQALPSTLIKNNKMIVWANGSSGYFSASTALPANTNGFMIFTPSANTASVEAQSWPVSLGSLKPILIANLVANTFHGPSLSAEIIPNSTFGDYGLSFRTVAGRFYEVETNFNGTVLIGTSFASGFISETVNKNKIKFTALTNETWVTLIDIENTSLAQINLKEAINSFHLISANTMTSSPISFRSFLRNGDPIRILNANGSVRSSHTIELITDNILKLNPDVVLTSIPETDVQIEYPKFPEIEYLYYNTQEDTSVDMLTFRVENFDISGGPYFVGNSQFVQTITGEIISNTINNFDKDVFLFANTAISGTLSKGNIVRITLTNSSSSLQIVESIVSSKVVKLRDLHEFGRANNVTLQIQTLDPIVSNNSVWNDLRTWSDTDNWSD